MGRHLTDTEALLWNLGHHANLGSTMGVVLILDGRPDPIRVRQTVARAVATVPCLHEAVLDTGVALASPTWVVDGDFDLDYHLRFLRLEPSKRTIAEATALAVQLINDPFDRTRPLWQMTVIGGVGRNKTAVVVKLHHCIADAQGALQLASAFLAFGPDQEDPPASGDVDLDSAIAALAAGQQGPPRGLGDTLRTGAEHLAATMGHAASALNDPSSLIGTGTNALASAQRIAADDQAPASTPSPLWAKRSRNRRYCHLAMPLDQLDQVAKSHQATINDLFLLACAEASLTLHQRHGVNLASVAAATVISTRGDDTDAAENAVIPAPVTVPGNDASTADRISAIQQQVTEHRETAGQIPNLLATLSGLVGFIPSSLTAAVALDQTAKIDIATSNIPGPPMDVWFAGHRIRHALPVGPVLGTAMNLTMLSLGKTAIIGLTADPVSVPDYLAFGSELVDTFKRLGVSGARIG